MRYLATVGQKPIWGCQKLHLHCKEIDKYCWVRLRQEISLELAHKFQLGSLVIEHITTNNNRLQRLDAATDAIVVVLHEFTNVRRRYKKLTEDINAWKHSREIQLEGLRRREEELLLRAEELQVSLTCSLDQIPKLTVPSSLEFH